jgi:glycosyltransferase involved in cell wall biosynthesis
MEDTSVIIPVYNEEESIGKIVKELKALYPDIEILVIDDGSTDNTANVASNAGAKVITHHYNIGNGAAIKTGVRYSRSINLVFMDGDGQHDPRDVSRLLSDLGEYDMVVGARTRGCDLSRIRNLGNRVMNMVANLLAEMKIPDLTSGFRAIKRDRVMEFLHLFPNRYSYPATITIAMLKAGYQVKYIPLDTIKKREKGKSEIRPIRDGFRFLIIIMRMIMLFDPLKVFLPASSGLCLFGILLAIYQIIFKGGIYGASILTILTGIFTFLFGLLADQISRLIQRYERGSSRE